MNVFEDLVAELQEENLLETTFVENNRRESGKTDYRVDSAVPVADYDLPLKYEAADEWSDQDPTEPDTESLHDDQIDYAKAASVEIMSIGDQAAEVTVQHAPAVPHNPHYGKESYKKRAVGEISNLQMVEHVLTGVEREYMKIVPNVYDDFNAKKSLHTFLQVAENENSSSYTEAEFTLLTETEGWCSALAKRDREIMVSSFRQYCENSRPALSSQALLALSRFYRNLPYSDSVRSKFDFVITRLFSRPTENERRVCLFTKDEILAHVNTLYKDWSSVALYSADDDESNVLLTALSFDDLATEAERAISFDQLIESDFFGRLRLFKESITELFYAPSVTAAAIDANVRIGNAYVSLIDRERQKLDSESIRSKYGTLHDSSISDAAARTLDLVELLKAPLPVAQIADLDPDVYFDEAFSDDDPRVVETAQVPDQKVKIELPPFVEKLLENARSVNRWFLGMSVLMILVSVGIYIWANYFVKVSTPSTSVKVLEVDSSPLQGLAKSARISGENCYFLMQADWDVMAKERKTEILQKAYGVSREKGCTQVSLLSKDGKMTGFASQTRLDIVMP